MSENFHKMLYKTFEDVWENSSGSTSVKILNFPDNIDVSYTLYCKIYFDDTNVVTGTIDIKWIKNKLSYSIISVNGNKSNSILKIGKSGNSLIIKSYKKVSEDETSGDPIKKIVLKYDMYDGYVSGEIEADNSDIENIEIIYDSTITDILYQDGDLYFIDITQSS